MPPLHSPTPQPAHVRGGQQPFGRGPRLALGVPQLPKVVKVALLDLLLLRRLIFMGRVQVAWVVVERGRATLALVQSWRRQQQGKQRRAELPNSRRQAAVEQGKHTLIFALRFMRSSSLNICTRGAGHGWVDRRRRSIGAGGSGRLPPPTPDWQPANPQAAVRSHAILTSSIAKPRSCCCTQAACAAAGRSRRSPATLACWRPARASMIATQISRDREIASSEPVAGSKPHASLLAAAAPCRPNWPRAAAFSAILNSHMSTTSESSGHTAS